MRDSVIVTNKLRLALGMLAALALASVILCSRQNTTTPTFADDESATTNSLPPAILQLFQNQANSPPWNEDSPTKTQAILQQCAALQQLLASNAPDDTLSNALAASTLRVSVFMTFGQTLSATGDTHHAEMFFTSVVNDHPARATTKQLARCDLWLGKLFQADALALKYQQSDPAAAGALFETAATDYLTAKDASPDWVRTSGWLGAAQCYRQLGQQAMCRLCLTSLIQELATNSIALTGTDVTLGPMRRDAANNLLATSFYEDGRYQDAANNLLATSFYVTTRGQVYLLCN